MVNKINYIIIVVLVLIILTQRGCDKFNFEEPTIDVKTDTVWKIKHDTVLKKVIVIKKEFVKPEGPEYEPGNNIDTCSVKFAELLHKYSIRTVYSDTIKIDSIGTIVVKDTVWLNKLHGDRTYVKDYKIPFVTKTVTITQKEQPKGKLFVGLNAAVNSNTVTPFSPGLIYQNKKDQLYQFTIGVDFSGNVTYGIGTYWKIKLKK